MQFVAIFGDSNCLLSVKDDNEPQDEFSKLFDLWTDIEYLDAFFTENHQDLSSPFWDGISIEQAINKTRNEAVKFRKHLKKIAEKPEEERVLLFLRFFKPLSKNKVLERFLDEKKAYAKRNNTWLRLYALKAGKDLYIITGGAIKLTEKMGERPHTKNELRKLEVCKRYLLDEGIVDEDGVIELLEL